MRHGSRVLVALVLVVGLTLTVVLALVAGAEPRGESPAAPSAPDESNAAAEPSSTPTRWQATARPGVDAGAVAGEPTRIRLPSGAELEVLPATTDTEGELIVPDDVQRAGWWDGGARVGDPFGTMVIAAHVDSEIQGLGPFAGLLSAAEGDVVETSAGPTDQTYVISDVMRIPREELPARDDLFTSSGPHRLVLITCAGDYVPQQGGYQELAVVVAEPSGRP